MLNEKDEEVMMTHHPRSQSVTSRQATRHDGTTRRDFARSTPNARSQSFALSTALGAPWQ